jgi:hypothetical protein
VQRCLRESGVAAPYRLEIHDLHNYIKWLRGRRICEHSLQGAWGNHFLLHSPLLPTIWHKMDQEQRSGRQQCDSIWGRVMKKNMGMEV